MDQRQPVSGKFIAISLYMNLGVNYNSFKLRLQFLATIFAFICVFSSQLHAGPKYSFKLGDRFRSAEKTNQEYVVIGFLGKGGFGDVYLVKDSRTGEEKALKWSRTTVPRSYFFKSPFLMPVQLESVLLPNNRNELVEIMPKGTSLSKILELTRDSNFHAKLKIAHQVFRDIQTGVQDLNRFGYVHNDIKSANIMLVEDRYVLSDYDTLTNKNGTDNIKWGSDLFMSPEQQASLPTTIMSDYFSLAVTMAEVLGLDLFSIIGSHGEARFISREKVIEALQKIDITSFSSDEKTKLYELVSFVDAALKLDLNERRGAIAKHFERYPPARILALLPKLDLYKNVKMQTGSNKGGELDTSAKRGLVLLKTANFIPEMNMREFGYIANFRHNGKFYVIKIHLDAIESVDFIYEKFKEMAGGHADLVYKLKRNTPAELLYEIIDAENEKGYELQKLEKPILLRELVMTAENVVVRGDKSGLVEGGLSGKFGITYRLTSVPERFLEPVINEGRRTTVVSVPMDKQRAQASFWTMAKSYSDIGMKTAYNLANNNCITSAVKALTFGLNPEDRKYLESEMSFATQELNRLTVENFTDAQIRRMLERYIHMVTAMGEHVDLDPIQDKDYFRRWFKSQPKPTNTINSCQGLFI